DVRDRARIRVVDVVDQRCYEISVTDVEFSVDLDGFGRGRRILHNLNRVRERRYSKLRDVRRDGAETPMQPHHVSLNRNDLGQIHGPRVGLETNEYVTHSQGSGFGDANSVR